MVGGKGLGLKEDLVPLFGWGIEGAEEEVKVDR